MDGGNRSGEVAIGPVLHRIIREVRQVGRRAIERDRETPGRIVLSGQRLGDCRSPTLPCVPRGKHRVGMVLGPLHRDSAAGSKHHHQWLADGPESFNQAFLRSRPVRSTSDLRLRSRPHTPASLLPPDSARRPTKASNHIRLVAATGRGAASSMGCAGGCHSQVDKAIFAEMLVFNPDRVRFCIGKGCFSACRATERAASSMGCAGGCHSRSTKRSSLRCWYSIRIECGFVSEKGYFQILVASVVIKHRLVVKVHAIAHRSARSRSSGIKRGRTLHATKAKNILPSDRRQNLPRPPHCEVCGRNSRRRRNPVPVKVHLRVDAGSNWRLRKIGVGEEDSAFSPCSELPGPGRR